MTVPRFSIQELIVCAEREVKYRKRVYARRIQLLKMSEAKADREIAMMQQIAEELRKLEPRLI